MEPIKSSDICSVCMDECNREFIYKTCCTLLICRVCLNQLEVESFPNNTCCPGCRQMFPKICFNAVTENEKTHKVAPCKAKVTEKEAVHINNCVKCLQEVVRGNNWFEEQFGNKYNNLKRKHDSLLDEVFVRNQRIRDITHENRVLTRELAVRNTRISALQAQRESTVARPRTVENGSGSSTVGTLEHLSVAAVVNHLRSQFESHQHSISTDSDILSDSTDSNDTGSTTAARTHVTQARSQRSQLFFSSSSSDSSPTPSLLTDEVTTPLSRPFRRQALAAAARNLSRRSTQPRSPVPSRRSLRLASIAAEINENL